MNQQNLLGLMALGDAFGSLGAIGGGNPGPQRALPFAIQMGQEQEKRQRAMDALRAAGINVGSAPAGGTPGILPPGDAAARQPGGMGGGLPSGANPALLAAYGELNPDALLGTLVEAQLNPKAPPAGPTSVEEFRFAQSQGFQGGYEDFLRQKASWSRAPGTSVKIVNEGSIPAGYEIERDQEGRPLRMRPIPGSPGYVDEVSTAGNVIATAESAIANIDALIADPRLKNATGWGSYVPVDIPGINAEVRARMKQMEGRAFSQALDTLRGLGAVSNVEGDKAAQALVRLSAAQQYDEYVAAAQEFRDIIAAGVERARGRLQTATGRTPPNVPPLTPAEMADDELMRNLGLE